MKYISVSGKHSDKRILVSDIDYTNLNGYKWYINSSGYATNGKIYLHQIIMPAELGKEVEHRDGDKLNNQRENLRYAERSQNHANRKKSVNSLFRFKGVRNKTDRYRKKSWQASIRKDYKTYHLGYFQTEKEAAMAYNKKAIELYGEFARVNVF